MQEKKLEQHGHSIPRTYNRGRRPIDGIYLSFYLDVSSCGYLRFRKGLPSDHRLLWFDIKIVYMLGHDLDLLSKVATRRLKYNGPRVRKSMRESMRSLQT
jgi:hypothetical protein